MIYLKKVWKNQNFPIFLSKLMLTTCLRQHIFQICANKFQNCVYLCFGKVLKLKFTKGDLIISNGLEMADDYLIGDVFSPFHKVVFGWRPPSATNLSFENFPGVGKWRHAGEKWKRVKNLFRIEDSCSHQEMTAPVSRFYIPIFDLVSNNQGPTLTPNSKFSSQKRNISQWISCKASLFLRF